MNASKMLARLERATKEKGVAVTEFLFQYGLPASTFYVIKKKKEIKPKMHKRYLEALRDFEPTLADAVEVEVESEKEDVVNSPQHYKRGGCRVYRCHGSSLRPETCARVRRDFSVQVSVAGGFEG